MRRLTTALLALTAALYLSIPALAVEVPDDAANTDNGAIAVNTQDGTSIFALAAGTDAAGISAITRCIPSGLFQVVVATFFPANQISTEWSASSGAFRAG